MSRRLVIALCGVAGAGKDTASTHLSDLHGFCRISFAEPIRHMIYALLDAVDAGPGWTVDRDKKERPIPGLGVSYRHLAQTLGTEWGRSLATDFWLRVAGLRMDVMDGDDIRGFVITDCRFANEAAFVRGLGGEVWRIDRPDAAAVRPHISEQELHTIAVDRVIDNSGSIDAMCAQLDAALAKFLERRP